MLLGRAPEQPGQPGHSERESQLDKYPNVYNTDLIMAYMVADYTTQMSSQCSVQIDRGQRLGLDREHPLLAVCMRRE